MLFFVGRVTANWLSHFWAGPFSIDRASILGESKLGPYLPDPFRSGSASSHLWPKPAHQTVVLVTTEATL